ncbi:MAG: TatD family nuclease-associated radical SAM protein [Coprobacillaceae bacterium]
MTILYTLLNNSYIDIANLSSTINTSVYINITNRCCCHCTFCLRQTKEMIESNSLWLKKEPTTKDVITELQKYSISNFKEIVFCGFGEPLTRINEVITIAKYIKEVSPTLPIRVNTNGLSSKTHNQDITPLLEGLIDTISISLNAPTKEEYYKLTQSIYGIDSFDEMLDFTKRCKKYIPTVIMSVVDIIGEDKIKASQKICDDLHVILKVRPFEE